MIIKVHFDLTTSFEEIPLLIIGQLLDFHQDLYELELAQWARLCFPGFQIFCNSITLCSERKLEQIGGAPYLGVRLS